MTLDSLFHSTVEWTVNFGAQRVVEVHYVTHHEAVFLRVAATCHVVSRVVEAGHKVRRVMKVYHEIQQAVDRIVRRVKEEGNVVQQAMEGGSVVLWVTVEDFLVLNEPVEFVVLSAVEDCAARFHQPELDSGLH